MWECHPTWSEDLYIQTVIIIDGDICSFAAGPIGQICVLRVRFTARDVANMIQKLGEHQQGKKRKRAIESTTKPQLPSVH